MISSALPLSFALATVCCVLSCTLAISGWCSQEYSACYSRVILCPQAVDAPTSDYVMQQVDYSSAFPVGVEHDMQSQ